MTAALGAFPDAAAASDSSQALRMWTHMALSSSGFRPISGGRLLRSGTLHVMGHTCLHSSHCSLVTGAVPGTCPPSLPST